MKGIVPCQASVFSYKFEIICNINVYILNIDANMTLKSLMVLAVEKPTGQRPYNIL